MSGGESFADAPVVAYPVYPAHAAYVPPPAAAINEYVDSPPSLMVSQYNAAGVLVSLPYKSELIKYNDAPCEIKIAWYKNCIFADAWNLDTANIDKWDPNAIVQKIIDGPPGLKGTWIVRKAINGFGPKKYARYDNITKALDNITKDKYPSRTEYKGKQSNVSLVNFCTINFSILICTTISTPHQCGVPILQYKFLLNNFWY